MNFALIGNILSLGKGIRTDFALSLKASRD
jgi:hypothetical protein